MTRLGLLLCLGFAGWLASCAEPMPSPAPRNPEPPISTPAGSAGYTLSGRLSDAFTGRPVAAEVRSTDRTGQERHATADADGRFALPPLPAGEIDLRVSAPGYVELVRRITLSGDAYVDDVLEPMLRSVSGTIIDGTSNGVLPNVRLQIAGANGLGPSTRTDATGRYAFPALTTGPLTLIAQSPAYVEQQRTLPRGGDAAVDFVLTRRPPERFLLPFRRSPALFFTEETYEDFGVRVGSTAGIWIAVPPCDTPVQCLVWDCRGSAPCIVLTSPLYGEIQVTSTRPFKFLALDMRTNVDVPFIITGSLAGSPQFTLTGTVPLQPQWFTFENRQSAAAVDSLTIRVTHRPDQFVPNTYLDSIWLER